MKNLWEFYKWGMGSKHQSEVISLAFTAATILAFLAYFMTAMFFVIEGWPIVSGLMIIVPLSYVCFFAVKVYKSEKDDQ